MLAPDLLVNPSILIIKPSSFGDVIHALPVARAIKLAQPEITVDWVVADNLEPLVAMSPHVDKSIPFRRASWTKWWRPSILADILAQTLAMRKKEYGAVIDLQGLLRSGLMTLACRGRTKSGFENAREGAAMLYDRRIRVPETSIHAVDRYMAAIPHLGIHFSGSVGYDLFEKAEQRAWAELALPKAPFAVVNPNSRWATKRWPLERFGALCREIRKRFGYEIVIIGAPEDAQNGAALSLLAGPGALDLTGKTTPPMLGSVFRRMEVLFSNDSGPLHLAVAVKGRTVSFFGPTDPAKTGPYGQRQLVLRSNRECSPCFKRVCPYDHECMKDISPVAAADAWEAKGYGEDKFHG
jgi:lipopolysaccharide heptosyltransferase I